MSDSNELKLTAAQIGRSQSENLDSEWFMVVTENGAMYCSCGRPLVAEEEGTYRCTAGYPVYRPTAGQVMIDKYGNLWLKTDGHGTVKGDNKKAVKKGYEGEDSGEANKNWGQVRGRHYKRGRKQR